MIDLLAFVVPPELAPLGAGFLVVMSFFTSAITGAIGLGGGLFMLAILATMLPPPVVIPVHGVVQIGSNLGRAVLMRREIDRELFWPFALGTVIGVPLGAMVVTELPIDVLRLLLAMFVLWAVWAPKIKPTKLAPRWFVAVGGVTSFVTMFLGATGPFVAVFVNPERLGRLKTVATHAACMTAQHAFKVAAFTAIGFAFLPWLPLLALMIGAGFVGTLFGRRFLDRLPEATFARIFKFVLTALALKLGYDAVTGFAGG